MLLKSKYPPSIPYKGTKRFLANEILKSIKKLNPSAIYFYDMFGGGASVSIASLTYYKYVIYNDAFPPVANLLETLIASDSLPKNIVFKWIDKEQFYLLIKKQDWIGGLIRCLWSYGCNFKDYLYSEESENYFKDLFFYILENKPTRVLPPVFNKIQSKPARLKYTINWLSANKKRFVFFSRLKRLYQFFDYQFYPLSNQYGLWYEEKWTGNKLKILNKDYKEVEISTPLEQSVIYCDIPYRTATQMYYEKFDYDEFYKWASSQKCAVFISEYECPIGEQIMEISRRCVLNRNDLNIQVKEKLFYVPPNIC